MQKEDIGAAALVADVYSLKCRLASVPTVADHFMAPAVISPNQPPAPQLPLPEAQPQPSPAPQAPTTAASMVTTRRRRTLEEPQVKVLSEHIEKICALSDTVAERDEEISKLQRERNTIQTQYDLLKIEHSDVLVRMEGRCSDTQHEGGQEQSSMELRLLAAKEVISGLNEQVAEHIQRATQAEDVRAAANRSSHWERRVSAFLSLTLNLCMVQAYKLREAEHQDKIAHLTSLVEEQSAKQLLTLQRYQPSMLPQSINPEATTTQEALEEKLYRAQVNPPLCSRCSAFSLFVRKDAEQTVVQEEMKAKVEDMAAREHHWQAERQLLTQQVSALETEAENQQNEHNRSHQRAGPSIQSQLEVKLREQLSKKDGLVRALRDTIKVLGAQRAWL